MAEATPIHEYKCLICTEPYSEPKLLHCGHTFCYQCLSLYVDAEYVAEDDQLYFPCPECEAPILHDDVNADVSTWVTCFPKNDLLTTPTSNPSGVRFCAPCSRGKESVPADVMCTDCNENLCGECRTHHERNKASAWHRLVFMSGDVGLLPDVTVYERCHRHGGRPFEVYCVDHHAMSCSTCTLVTHRQCNNVKPVEEVIQKTTATPSIVGAELKELTEETKKLLDEENFGITELNVKEKDVLIDLSNRIQKAKDKLDDLKTISQSEVANKFREFREQLLSRRKCINAFHINAKNSNTLLAGQEQHLSERHHFFLGEQTKTQISSHYRRMDQNTKKKTNRFDITLRLDAVIEEIMKMTTIAYVDVTSSVSTVSQNARSRIDSSIGRFLSTPPATFADSTSTSDLAGSLGCVAVETTEVTRAVDVWSGSVSCVHTVDASILGGMERPGLTGGIFTNNNGLIITDYTNNRLLLFDDKYSYQREYKVDGRPTDIARGRTADEILVAVVEYSRFLAVVANPLLRCTLRNGQLPVMSRISAPPSTWGIAIHGENILVGTPESVQVLSVGGNVTKSIKKGGDNTYLAVSSSNFTLYHKDDDDVVCRRLDSEEVVYRYRNPGLCYPRGIGLDRDHNVYVCGTNSKNVYLISPDGSIGRVILPKLPGITRPYGIVVHPTKQEFVVTSYEESTALEVYRFSGDK
ncbi:tripartite motif-containing protein 3-like [Argopecten irradians]|uniref:tripartite motif-containing protein 3-like n=1 Tax=Argopecten irradians TaxID=31199 RepID=UPI0037230691